MTKPAVCVTVLLSFYASIIESGLTREVIHCDTISGRSQIELTDVVVNIPSDVERFTAEVTLEYDAGPSILLTEDWHYTVHVNITGEVAEGITSLQDELTLRNSRSIRTFQTASRHELLYGQMTLTVAPVEVSGAIPENIDLVLLLHHEPKWDPGNARPPKPRLSGRDTLVWQPVDGCQYYEVESAFIDDLAGYTGRINPFTAKVPVRVSTADTLHVLDLQLTSGTVAVRYRAVGTFGRGGLDFGETRRYSKWSETLSMQISKSASPSTDLTEFEPNLNWQSASTFAEQGRRLRTLTYFDGSLRRRQTAQSWSRDDLTLVTDVKYDHEGRSPISILPTPTKCSDLGFRALFHLSSSGTAYGAVDVDTWPDMPLAATSGAGQYYREFLDGFGYLHRYTPRSDGYPFSLVRFVRDNSGRVEYSSGIGEHLRVDGDNSSQFVYGTATQSDLFRLFGSNSGVASAVKRDLVIDPNAQGLIAFKDGQDRVIATALTGANPPSLDRLPGIAVDTVRFSLAGNNTISIERGISRSVSRIPNRAGAYCDFTYSLSGVQYEPDLGEDFPSLPCRECTYELTIQIISPTGRQIKIFWDELQDSVETIVDTVFPEPGVPCVDGSYTWPDIHFRAFFARAGSYSVIKTLRQLSGALDSTLAFWETEPEAAELYTPAFFIAQQLAMTDTSLCNLTCVQHCREMLQKDNQAHYDTTGEWLYTDEQLPEAVSLCCDGFITNHAIDRVTALECSSLFEMMKQDVSPGGWLFDSTGWLEEQIGNTGLAGTVCSDNLDDQEIRECLLDHWDVTVATMLLPEHPEWCHVEKCWNDSASAAYDRRMDAIEHPVIALVRGYYNPADMDGAPGLPSGYCEPDPFLSYARRKEMMKDMLQVFYIDSFEIIGVDTVFDTLTIWEYVSNGKYYHGPLDAYDENSASIWTTFRSLYQGLKDEIRDQESSEDLGCPYMEYSRALVKRPLVRVDSSTATDSRDSLLTSYCEQLAETRAEFLIQELKDSCDLPPSLALHTKEVLAQYLLETCGLKDPLGLITRDELIAGHLLLEYVESKLPPNCSLKQIAVEDPYTYDTICNLICDTLFHDDCVEMLLELVNERLPAQIPDTIPLYSPVYSEFADDCAPFDSLLIIYDTVLVFQGVSEDEQCRLAFYYSKGDLVSFSQVEKLHSPQYEWSFPSDIQASPDLFKNLTVQVVAGHGEADRTAYLFSDCPLDWPADPQIVCDTLVRPSACAEEAFRLLNAYWPRPLNKLITFDEDDNPECYLAVFANKELVTFIIPADYLEGLKRKVPIDSCRIVFYDRNGNHISLSDADGFVNLRCVAEVPGPFEVDPAYDLPFAELAVDILMRNRDSLTGYIFTDCDVAATKDCEIFVKDLDWPETKPLAPDDWRKDCLELQRAEAEYEGRRMYDDYMFRLATEYRDVYANKCFDPPFLETFTGVAYTSGDYQFTLYYWDAADNLIQTVPPAGVDTLPSSTVFEFLTGAAAAGDNPQHGLKSRFKYNTRNQVIWQHTPDGGEIRIWYDRKGQARFSQDEKQAQSESYSYTHYDRQGRVIEVGQITGPNVNVISLHVDSSWYPSHTDTSRYSLSEITRTYYDTDRYLDFKPPGFEAENLRGRVASVTYQKTLEDSPVASFYSYDAHGNIRSFVQHIAELGSKRMDYTYDLISGNVTRIAYQEGYPDQMFHRYEYDIQDRLSNVFTSIDGVFWDRDAQYEYYAHGPLAREELGHDRVQGLDYVYTLQGWTKGVNSNTLAVTRDPGVDGDRDLANNPNHDVAPDVIGYSLGYFREDYVPVDVNLTSNNLFVADHAGSNFGQKLRGLYDGKISHMVTAMHGLGSEEPVVQASAYGYDQLYRLTRMETDTNLDRTANVWRGTVDDNTNYSTEYTYDANGNIRTLTRNGKLTQPPAGQNLKMDELTYFYDEAAGGSLLSNRLLHIKDAVSADAYGHDLDDQDNPSIGSFDPDNARTHNYAYDEIGNLVRDRASGIEMIEWNSYGRVTSVIKDTDGGPDLEFTYDGEQNRMSKIVKPHGSDATQWTYIYYVRDPQGEVMATYRRTTSPDPSGTTDHYVDSVFLTDHSLYGWRRLGLRHANKLIQTHSYSAATDTIDGSLEIGSSGYDANSVTFNNATAERITGQKQYELVNHLGNVLATVSDLTDRVDENDDDVADLSRARILSLTGYYPYGMRMPGRAVGDTAYRFGFNGMERDIGWVDNSNIYCTLYRIYDARVGRWLSVDPRVDDLAAHSSYMSMTGNPISITDPLGDKGLDDKRIDVLDYYGVLFIPGYAEEMTEDELHDYMQNRIAHNAGFLAAFMSVAGVSAVAGLEYLASRTAPAPTGRPGDVGDIGPTAEPGADKQRKKTHGNKLDDKPAEGYTLQDRDTGEIKKYGETTWGEDAFGRGKQKRYTKKYLKKQNVDYVKEKSGTKKEMHQWQHKKILQHKKEHGKRPDLNKSDY
ncbi:MAG: RHS repeat-associated core domain-containing protein [bacterium]